MAPDQQQQQQQERRRQRHTRALLLPLAAAALLLLPTPTAAAPVANIQSIHGCDCIGVCDRGSAGRYNTPTCYVNVSSCNYMLGRQKAPMTGRAGRNTTAPYDRFAVPYEEIQLPPLADGTRLPPATRVWDYCQDPTWVPRASNITTASGCKCLELYQVSACGQRAAFFFLGSVAHARSRQTPPHPSKKTQQKHPINNHNPKQNSPPLDSSATSLA